MKSIYLEQFSPYILGLSAIFIWWQLGLTLPTGDGILGSSLTLGAILTGFLATAKAIIMTLDSPIMQRLRETDYIHDIVSYLSQAIWLSFAFCILTLVGFFIDKSLTWYGMAWIGIGVMSAGAFIRVTNIMLKIIKHSPKNDS